MNKKEIPSLNNYICAEHNNVAKGWVQSLGYSYYSAKNKKELNDALKILSIPSEKPIFLEVFTDKEKDAFITREFYNLNKPETSYQEKIKQLGKKIINKFK